MVNDLMRVVTRKPLIREQRIGVESRASFDVLFHFRLQCVALAVRNYDSANLAATLQDAHDSSLVFGSSSSDPALAFTDVHVSRFAADEGFVRFNLPR